MRMTLRVLLIFLFSSALAAEELYDPIAVYLTWRKNPESTMVIQWITLEDREEDLVEFYQADHPEPRWHRSTGKHQSVPGLATYLIHRVELTGLSPSTDYYFRTGSDAKAYKFRTMPASLTGGVSFVVGGDIYHDKIEAVIETNRQAARTYPLFALVGGDLAYAADRYALFSEGMQSWVDWMLAEIEFRPEKRLRWIEWLAACKEHLVTPDGRLVPLIPSIGNHDVNGGFNKSPADAVYFHTFFPMPGKKGYDVLDFGNYLTLLILDSGHTNPIGGRQTKWLYETLKSRQSFPHKIALYHVPAYPSVRKFAGKTSAAIRHHWCPLFDRFGVDAAFEHHDHAYKRSHPIRAGKVHTSGTVYLGDGAWGVERPRVPKKASDVWYLAQTAARRHFIKVSITPGSKTFTAIGSNGEVLDEFSLLGPRHVQDLQQTSKELDGIPKPNFQ